MTTNYIFVTGGVVSSLGKGIAAASLAAILEARGLNVTIMKLDPYINVDPGTMVLDSAWGSFRHRRRRRNRSGFGSLRALHPHQDVASQQLHHRPHLLRRAA